MNNKTYSKIRRKKSFASLILAFLLMLTFNSSPIILVTNNVRKANAYKSSETKTYYSSATNESESKFSDPQYPSIYKDDFYDPTKSKNFNLNTYYNAEFERLYLEKADKFLREYDYDYATKYQQFLGHFGVDNLSEFLSENKNESILIANLSVVSARELIARIALNGFEDYDKQGSNLPAVSTSKISKYRNLSDFYRLFANIIAENGDINKYPSDESDSPNNQIDGDEAFYKKPTYKQKQEGTLVGNSHYNRLVDYIDSIILETAPIYAFDNETQDTNVAAIIANQVPLSVAYNYAGTYNSYTKPSISYTTTKHPTTQKEGNFIYYFGSQQSFMDSFPKDDPTTSDVNEHDVAMNEYLDANDGYFVLEGTSNSILSEGERTVDNTLMFKLITPEDGDAYSPYVKTYYKYKSSPYQTTSSNSPGSTSTSKKIDIYYLTDSETTQDDIDTFKSAHVKELTPETYAAEKEFFFHVPYENDGQNLYFKALFKHELYSSEGFYGSDSDEKFKSFVEAFTTVEDGVRTSKLYLRFNSTTNKLRYVYIDPSLRASFEGANSSYSYILRDLPNEYKEEDYELIVNNSSNSGYYVSEEYPLYFEKNKEPYQVKTDPIFSEKYEVTYDAKIPFETEPIATNNYETVTPGSTERKIYILKDPEVITDPDQTEQTIQSTDGTINYTFSLVSQETIDANSSFYVSVPSYIYNSKKISDTYKLYYMHTSTNAKKLYIVDDSDNASDNKIYETLNFNVISSNELKSNITNYIAVKEGDANYNKNFQLYYKYDRDVATDSNIYVLNQKGISVGSTIYKLVESKDLSDYVLIDKETNESTYTTVKNALPIDPNMEISLYYKLEDVFVQNKLKGGNAIFVLDPTISKDDRDNYAKLMYTQVTQKEIDANPDLYVLIDSNDESNYLADYKLYYKYKAENTPRKIIYDYEDIDQTTDDFGKNGYVLIPNTSDDYQEGKELYYKKQFVSTNYVDTPRPTFFYYQTSSTTTLSSNSYYVVSFYVNTIGENARASLIIKDTAKILTDIKVTNIDTEGKWEKYYVFLSTDAATSSTINIYLYLGDEEHGIKGDSSAIDTLTASVFFDDIKITKIGVSDFTKRAIDNKLIYSEATLYKEPANTPDPVDDDPEPAKYADEHNNRVYIANDDERFDSTNWDIRKYLNIEAYKDAESNQKYWNDLFKFEDAGVQDFLGKDTGKEEEKKNNKLALPEKDSDGFDMYTSSFNVPWKYYISRDLENDFSIDNYINAYRDGKLEVTTTSIIEESEEPEEDEDADEEEKEDEAEKSDIKYVSTPFNDGNFALKLKNTSKDTALGITSNSFKIKQFEYYKISLWIYSPDLEGQASISVNSILTDRQHPTNGSLLSSTISATYANVENSSSKDAEYGWIPVTLYIEGNNFQDLDCYLVLTAEKDCTVYFDNIRIEKTTSTQYDSAKSSSSSNKYISALSLTPSSSLISSDLTNGTFDYVKETSTSHDVTSDTPYAADNWTVLTDNSKRAVAGIVSLQQPAFFNKYSKDTSGTVIIPKEYDGITGPNGDTLTDISNIYAIYSPAKVESFGNSALSPKEIDDYVGNLISYKHKYSIYSASISLSANSLYRISFKVFKNDNFSGQIFSNIYASAVKDANIVASIEIDESQLADESWQTITYYIATSTSSQTVYLEIGVKDAQNTCFFKSASAKKLTGKTINSVIQSEATKNGIDNTTTEDLYNAFKTIRFIDLSNADFSNHSPEVNTDTNLFDPKSFTDQSDVTTEHTAGKVGVTVASYFDTINHTTYSVTINKTTYYIGEVYEVELDSTKYYVHRTYDSANNTYNYKLYSDSELTNEVTKINDTSVDIEVVDGFVKVNDVAISNTTYRLFKYADLREEVTEISGSDVSVPSLENVVVGKGAHATETAITSTQNTSYVYHFGTPTKSDYEVGNTIISADELKNAQSANVMILSNSHSTDYVSLKQSSMRTLGKSTYNVLRIYVKTSDFSSEDVGLNIEVSAVNVEWTNINTTKSDKADKYGFVCYEILVSSNSTDSISNFGVEFSLGNTDSSEVGYAIISKVTVETLSSKEIFEHYSAVVGDDNDNIKKAIYTSEENKSEKDEEEIAEDENSMSWATFFYVFSSILLVVTMAVAMVAILLKKHPIKLAEKFENEHDRDIQTIKSKTTRIPRKSISKKDEIVIELSEENKDTKKSKKSDGEIV